MTSGESEQIPGEILDELMRRFRAGGRPALEDLCDQYPAYAAQLREVVPAMCLLEQIKPSPQSVAARMESPSGGEMIGDYELIRELGRGGMGVVYEAWQKTLRRRVALKIMSPQLAGSPTAVERFRREARAAAQLHHTSIVPVFDVGEDEAGRPFYTMQYISGTSLDQVLRHVQSGLPDCRDCRTAARIILQLADALAYSHQRGTLHRDIKPSNILIDDSGTAFLTDFGLARIGIDQPDQDPSDAITRSGELFGTLRYLPPERLEGKHLPAGDIYSLGATFYEILAHRPMFDESDRMKLAGDIISGRILPVRQAAPWIPRDLETIIRRATEADPRNRYADVRLMADDLRLFLLNRPIRSRRITLTEQILRWCGRNRTTASLIGIVLLLVLTLTVGRIVFLRLQDRHRQVVDLLERTTTAERESQAFARLGEFARFRQTGLAGLMPSRKLIELNTAELSDAARSELRNEWLSSLTRCDWSVTKSIPCPGDVAALDRLNARMACVTAPGQITVFPVDQSSPPTVISDLGFTPLILSFSGNGRFLLAGIYGQLWHVIDLERASPIHEMPLAVVECSISESADVLAMCDSGNRIIVQSLQAGRLRSEITRFTHASRIQTIRLDPAGTRVAVQDADDADRLTVIRLADGQNIFETESRRALCPEWSPDGQLLAVSDATFRISIWNVNEQRRVASLTGHTSMVSDLAWHPSSDFLLSTSWDAQVRLWNVWSGRTLVRSNELFSDLSFDAAGRRLGWAIRDGLLKASEWTAGFVHDLPFDARDGRIAPEEAAVHPDGRLLAIRTFGSVVLFDLLTNQRIGELPAGGSLACRFTPDGSRLLVVTEQTTLIIPVAKSTTDGSPEIILGPIRPVVHPRVTAVSFLPDSSRFLAILASRSDRVSEIAVSDGQVLRDFGTVEPGLVPQLLDSDSLVVLAGWHSRTIRILGMDGSDRATLSVPIATIPSASKTGAFFTTNMMDRIQFWNTKDWTPEGVVPFDAPIVGARVTFHPNGQLMAAQLLPNRLGLIDLRSKAVVARIDELDESWVWHTTFTPDGSLLIQVCHHPHCVRVWNLAQMEDQLIVKSLHWDAPTVPAGSAPTVGDKLVSPTAAVRLVVDPVVVRDGTPEDRRAAIARARTRLSDVPDDPAALNSTAWSLLIAPVSLQEPVSALDFARRCCQLAPGVAPYQNTLALACIRNHLLEEAGDLLIRNLQVSTPDQLTLDLVLLAITARKQGRLAESEAWERLARLQLDRYPPESAADKVDCLQLLREVSDLRTP